MGLSPFVCSIDKSIISNASGRQKFVPCLKENLSLAFTRPHTFARLKEFQLILGVYTGTYVAANLTDTMCRHHFECNPLFPVFAATSMTSITLGVLKDRAFVRMFGTTAPKPLPLLTYVLFGIRDSMTILGSFSLVPFVGEWIHSKNSDTLSKQSSTQVAQLACPMTIQCLSTPLHLTGLDLYNRPAAALPARASFIRAEYIATLSGRVARIAPAFGFGGIGNALMRKRFEAMAKAEK